MVILVITAVSFLFMSLLLPQTRWFPWRPWSEVVALCYTAAIHVGFSDSCLSETGQWGPRWVVITVAHDLKGELACAVPPWRMDVVVQFVVEGLMSATPRSDKKNNI